jgi:hypothetical protein
MEIQSDRTSVFLLALKRSYDSVRKVVLHNILTEFGTKLVSLIQM